MADEVEKIHIGGRLRHARRLQGLSMKQVAERVGCSESFISKLERDLAQPSLSFLHRLATTLGINIASLFDEQEAEADRIFIVRADRRPRIHTQVQSSTDEVVLEQIAPLGANSLLQANIHVVAPRGGGHEEISHVGEEVGLVLEGELELTIEGQTWNLQVGDSFAFPSEFRHRYRNPGEVEARILWVNSPPTF